MILSLSLLLCVVLTLSCLSQLSGTLAIEAVFIGEKLELLPGKNWKACINLEELGKKTREFPEVLPSFLPPPCFIVAT